MKRNDEGMYELGSWNMDEFMYRHYGTTHRSWPWKAGMKLKWWAERLLERLKKPLEVREFLHFDLRQLRYHRQFKKTPTMLRFVNEEGILVQQRFIVYIGYSYITMKEANNSRAKEVKGPKGPITTKPVKLIKTQRTLQGKRKTWEVAFGQTL